jgi:hypothetical protein
VAGTGVLARPLRRRAPVGLVARGRIVLASRLRIVAMVRGGVRMPVHLIAVEKKEPFRCGVWQVSSEALGLAQRDNEQAMERLKQCEESDNWPTGYEEKRVLDSIA